MELINCSEHGHIVSNKATACPNCDCPIENKCKCSECGNKLNPNDRFCPNCGTKV